MFRGFSSGIKVYVSIFTLVIGSGAETFTDGKKYIDCMGYCMLDDLHWTKCSMFHEGCQMYMIHNRIVWDRHGERHGK